MIVADTLKNKYDKIIPVIVATFIDHAHSSLISPIKQTRRTKIDQTIRTKCIIPDGADKAIIEASPFLPPKLSTAE
jgi:hypothetical protein